MNKAELVQAVSTRTGSSPAEARKHVEAVLDSIVTGVAEGDRVSLLGFGTFEPAARAARTTRNPRTGEPVAVPAAVVPRFRTGAAFKTRVASTAGPASPKAAKSAKAAPASTPKPAKKDTPKVVEEPAKKAKKSDAKSSGKASDTKAKGSKGSKGKDSKSKKGKKSKKK